MVTLGVLFVLFYVIPMIVLIITFFMVKYHDDTRQLFKESSNYTVTNGKLLLILGCAICPVVNAVAVYSSVIEWVLTKFNITVWLDEEIH